MYADATYYFETYGGTVLDPETAGKYLDDASTDVDELTYYRINHIGWDKLTAFQKEQIQKVCCKQAEFRCANADIFESPFTSYSINGVAMSFGNSAFYGIYSGIPMENTTYKMLMATGLATDIFYPREVR